MKKFKVSQNKNEGMSHAFYVVCRKYHKNTGKLLELNPVSDM